jgi:hypothetical protein
VIDICFIYFRTLTLDHLDAAWFTLAKQDFAGVQSVIFLDNNTDDDPEAIQAVLDRYPLPVPRILCFEKHGDSRRTQSWSVNRVTMGLARGPLVFLTRADFLLNYDCLAKMRAEYLSRDEARRNVFITSHCHQMGCDAALSNLDVLAGHSARDAAWRSDPQGPASLLGVEHANLFQMTHVDAGVWLTPRAPILAAAGLNEKMVAWGYQQQEFQRRLARQGTEMCALPEFLFHHQHHWAVRDVGQANAESAG